MPATFCVVENVMWALQSFAYEMNLLWHLFWFAKWINFLLSWISSHVHAKSSFPEDARVGKIYLLQFDWSKFVKISVVVLCWYCASSVSLGVWPAWKFLTVVCVLQGFDSCPTCWLLHWAGYCKENILLALVNLKVEAS